MTLNGLDLMLSVERDSSIDVISVFWMWLRLLFRIPLLNFRILLVLLLVQVLLCGGLESAPMSPAYEILASGCLAADPSPPKKPPYAPEAIAHSPTSVLLRWLPPPLDLEALEPPREGFWVSWRGGGAKSLGWKEQAYVTESNATVKTLEQHDESCRKSECQLLICLNLYLFVVARALLMSLLSFVGLRFSGDHRRRTHR